MTKFKVGEKYSMFSPYCYPLGRYSMCPVLRAGR